METTYIEHHGIKGQKWGARNGPPYPLKPSDHSAAEKSAARATSGGVSKRKVKYGGVQDMQGMSDAELTKASTRSKLESTYRQREAAANAHNIKNTTDASKLSTEELKAYNDRRAAVDQYKKYQKDDYDASVEERTKGLRTAKSIVDNANNINNAIDKSIRAYHEENRKARKAAMDLSKMSDDDLRKAINRMNLERQYRDLTPVEISRGERVAANILRTTGTVMTTSSSALDIALKIKELID